MKITFDISNLTNGEVLKTVFPDLQIRDSKSNFYEFTLDGLVGYAVEKVWWNAPYKYKKPTIGSWIECPIEPREVIDKYECSNCGETVYEKRKYCPECGERKQ